MKLTEKEVRYVADLANLSFSDEEVCKFARELDGILEHMDKLNELDTTNVEPMAQVLYAAGETATLRPDRECPPLGTETALANAPFGLSGYYDMLLNNAFGNFRQLLEDVTLHPTMGVYLNMLLNDKPDPVTGTSPNGTQPSASRRAHRMKPSSASGAISLNTVRSPGGGRR